ncbi:plasmid pRiA4b ORF-3 family protein [Pseudonocardia sp. K10HN5]|uniref:Plasmid pRiA4b ORF-3 family protein n=1 Tax=Pseudonocardia acidicola TaxID=2724939 RepID=A0ABX1S8I7_9PSEU|nr:plasmid pRiA4b ORF-3 family protein [Pseudonocardia acidicola]
MTDTTKTFEIEIVLQDVRAAVTRLVQVPGEASPAALHEVVQSAMGSDHLALARVRRRRRPVRDTRPGGGMGRPAP